MGGISDDGPAPLVPAAKGIVALMQPVASLGVRRQADGPPDDGSNRDELSDGRRVPSFEEASTEVPSPKHASEEDAGGDRASLPETAAAAEGSDDWRGSLGAWPLRGVRPPIDISAEIVRDFDAKPQQAGVSLRQLRRFLEDMCGEHFEILKTQCMKTATHEPHSLRTQASMLAVSDFYAKPLTKSWGCSVAQYINPEGMHADVFISHDWCHDPQDLLQQLTLLAARLVHEGNVDKSIPDDVAFWISAFSMNQHTAKKMMGPKVPLSAYPFSMALERSRHFVLVLNSKATALSRLWTYYEVLSADSAGRAVELFASDARVAARAALSAFSEAQDVRRAMMFSEQHRPKILEVMQSFCSSDLGEGIPAAQSRVQDLLRGALLRLLAKSATTSGDSVDERAVALNLLRGVRNHSERANASRQAAEVAEAYGNLEMHALCESAAGQGDPGTDAVAPDAPQGDKQPVMPEEGGAGEEAAVPASSGLASSPEPVKELPPPLPAEALELMNIGIDFSQRLSILWVVDLDWPPLFRNIVAWLSSLLAFDWGVWFPSISQFVRAAAAWAWPLILLVAVLIVSLLHRDAGRRWEIVFRTGWQKTRVVWLVLSAATCAVLIVAIVAAAPSGRSTLLFIGAQWFVFNVVVALAVLFARAQAQRTRDTARQLGLDEAVMTAGFHNFMLFGLCTVIGMLFVASWVPPVRTSLDIAIREGSQTFFDFLGGVGMALSAGFAFSVLPVFIATMGLGEQSLRSGLLFACAIPAPFSVSLFVVVVVIFEAFVLPDGDDISKAAGFLLPWFCIMPMACVLASLRFFSTHPFGALVAGNFRFRHHRILSFISRASFASVVLLSATTSKEAGKRPLAVFPGVGVLTANVLYILAFRPYTLRIGNVLDAASSFVLAIFVSTPLFPTGSAVDITLTCLLAFFIVTWVFSLRPRAVLRALYASPARMRARLQASVHAPAWMQACSAEELAHVELHEVVFWSLKHMEAVTDRCQASSDDHAVRPKLQELIKTCAMHAQDTAVRLAAAGSMRAVGMPDEAIFQAALAARLEDLAKELNSMDSVVRCGAAQELGQIGEPASCHVAALGARCARREERAVRCAAAEALGKIGKASAGQVAILADMLTEKDDDVRYAAAGALGDIGEPAFRQSQRLSKSLPEGHPFLRVAASWQLGLKMPGNAAAAAASAAAPRPEPPLEAIGEASEKPSIRDAV